jgi:hypothetical protein
MGQQHSQTDNANEKIVIIRHSEIIEDDTSTEPREYFDMDLLKLFPELTAKCSGDKRDNYHCEKLDKLIFCVANQTRYSRDPFLNHLCEKNEDSYWHSNYHIKNLYKSEKYEGAPSYKDILNLQRKFRKVYDDLKSGEMDPKPFVKISKKND